MSSTDCCFVLLQVNEDDIQLICKKKQKKIVHIHKIQVFKVCHSLNFQKPNLYR